ncbi:hypothetical protein ABK040_011889 [Willaertia magna]
MKEQTQQSNIQEDSIFNLNPFTSIPLHIFNSTPLINGSSVNNNPFQQQGEEIFSLAPKIDPSSIHLPNTIPTPKSNSFHVSPFSPLFFSTPLINVNINIGENNCKSEETTKQNQGECKITSVKGPERRIRKKLISNNNNTNRHVNNSTSNAIETTNQSSPLSTTKEMIQTNTSPTTKKKAKRQKHCGVTKCSNCFVTQTPMWRKSAEGETVCNKCGLYLKRHGSVRPMSLSMKKRKVKSSDTSSTCSSSSEEFENPPTKQLKHNKVTDNSGFFLDETETLGETGIENQLCENPTQSSLLSKNDLNKKQTKIIIPKTVPEDFYQFDNVDLSQILNTMEEQKEIIEQNKDTILEAFYLSQPQIGCCDTFDNLFEEFLDFK